MTSEVPIPGVSSEPVRLVDPRPQFPQGRGCPRARKADLRAEQRAPQQRHCQMRGLLFTGSGCGLRRTSERRDIHLQGRSQSPHQRVGIEYTAADLDALKPVRGLSHPVRKGFPRQPAGQAQFRNTLADGLCVHATPSVWRCLHRTAAWPILAYTLYAARC